MQLEAQKIGKGFTSDIMYVYKTKAIVGKYYYKP